MTTLRRWLRDHAVGRRQGWLAIRQRWTAENRALLEDAVRRYGPTIEEDPEDFEDEVLDAMNKIHVIHRRLMKLRGHVPEAHWLQASRRWQAVAAGIFSEAELPGQRTEVGAAPVVVAIVVAGVAISIVAIAWAIVSTGEIERLNRWTSLAEHELDERVRASEEARELQQSTLPAPPENDALNLPDVPGGGTGMLVGLGALTTLLLGGAVAYAYSRKAS